jgi:hypothetical protein
VGNFEYGIDFRLQCPVRRWCIEDYGAGVVGVMAILQQLSCESSTRSTLFQFREGVSGKRNNNTAIVRPNELRELDLSL